ncbi:MAG: sensor histidine kinase [Bacteroidia bacterium]
MNPTRILTHIAFWAVYFSINLYNELYLSASFSQKPSINLFFEGFLAQSFILLIKMGVSYFLIYQIMPKWIQHEQKKGYLIYGLLVLLIGAFIIRLSVHYVIWEHIYHEVHHPLSFLRLLARYFYSLLDLLQISAVVVAIKLFRMRIEATEKEKNMIQEKLKSEILHLKSQTNPHFLFNTLNSIYALCRAKSADAATAVMQLSTMLRYMLYQSAQKTSTISEELQVIADYISLQKLRFRDRIRFVFSQKIDNLTTQITPLLLLPLVENAFKHSQLADAVINCELRIEKEQLFFQISNPIADISMPIEGQTGIGLSNIQRQLELLYQQFSFEYGIKKARFTVTLQINLQTYAGTELFDNRR